MKYLIIAVLLALAVLGSAAFILSTPTIQRVTSVPDSNVKRGAYLARISGCVACHTNGESGEPLAGGVALTTKFGTFYSPNITMDQVYGIGEWSLDDFAVAVRHGTSREGKPYYPAFPYPFYATLDDRDIIDLWAAIQIVPPAKVASKPHNLNFPFNIRDGMRIWKSLFLEEQVFEKDPSKSPAWNRGRLIAEGPAHCGACHTPRNLVGARIKEKAFLGDPTMLDGGMSPPIDSVSLKEKGWSKADLVRALKLGVKPNGDVFGGSMAEVVRDGTSYLLPLHLEDLATFLLDDG